MESIDNKPKENLMETYEKERKHIIERLDVFNHEDNFRNQNKFKHLKDRLLAADRVLSGKYDKEDLLTKDIYNMIWGVTPENIDMYQVERYTEGTPLNLVFNKLPFEEMKHLQEYAKDELKIYFDFILETEPKFDPLVEKAQ